MSQSKFRLSKIKPLPYRAFVPCQNPEHMDLDTGQSFGNMYPVATKSVRYWRYECRCGAVLLIPRPKSSDQK